MSEKFEITLTYERTMTFNVQADTAYDAYDDAARGFMYGDLDPDDEGISSLELTNVKVGDREIRIVETFDFNAPKVRGLAPRKYIAYEEPCGTRLGESGNLKALLAEHFATTPAGGEAAVRDREA
ncbi:hypothetical protein [Amycolatopsis sp. CFH S0078]|uniref:hypothetical protein n=1 Tax=Amycolatopsis sp. CFH S0078 TaxID=1644108 RepID=UPI00106E5A89|nr:hypothetical protein [Amycolatopsis sp. CFH S0078]